jgi:pimeloyl-ACP methyl ester carboxylesterase
MPPRFLYLHGFASGPSSKKGTAFERHFAPKGVPIERLDLRVPSFPTLRLSAGLEVVRAAIGGDRDRAVVIGSSLGGLTAARVAERDPRVATLVLLAPAFQLVARWRSQLGEDAWTEWQRLGSREVTDRTTNQPARIDFGFVEDLSAIDVDFPDIRVPTLIFHGIHDDAVPVDHSRRFAAGKRHVRLVELDDDHDLMSSLPRILEETDRFLTPWLGADRAW